MREYIFYFTSRLLFTVKRIPAKSSGEEAKEWTTDAVNFIYSSCFYSISIHAQKEIHQFYPTVKNTNFFFGFGNKLITE